MYWEDYEILSTNAGVKDDKYQVEMTIRLTTNESYITTKETIEDFLESGVYLNQRDKMEFHSKMISDYGDTGYVSERECE
jgi:hypothetical protein